jgi:hypothetical protein
MVCRSKIIMFRRLLFREVLEITPSLTLKDLTELEKCRILGQELLSFRGQEQLQLLMISTKWLSWTIIITHKMSHKFPRKVGIIKSSRSRKRRKCNSQKRRGTRTQRWKESSIRFWRSINSPFSLFLTTLSFRRGHLLTNNSRQVLPRLQSRVLLMNNHSIKEQSWLRWVRRCLVHRRIPSIALMGNSIPQESLQKNNNALGIACQGLEVSATRRSSRSVLEDEKVAASAETRHWTT